MPVPGVTPFPPEFAARYRARGYWDDQPLITHFLKVFADHAVTGTGIQPPSRR